MLQPHSTCWSRVLRCTVIVAAWQAPVPFCHTHGTLATSAAPWLADHLRTCHAAVDPFTPSVFGWHLHFALPDAGDATPDQPQPVRDQIAMPDLGSCACCARLQSASISWSGDADGLLAVAFAPRSSRDMRHRGGFFETFAPEMPLPVRLGVLRC